MIAYWLLLAAAPLLAAGATGIERALGRQHRVGGAGARRAAAGLVRRDAAAAAWRLWTPLDVALVTGLIALAGMRSGVGTDFAMYHRRYLRADTASLRDAIAQSPQEVGFTTLLYLGNQLTEDPAPIFWACAVLTVLPTYHVIKKQSPNLMVSVFAYVALGSYLMTFNVMRQGVAVSLNFLALYYLQQRCAKRFVALNALAVTFHSTALVAAVVQLVAWRWRPGRRTLVVGLAALVAVLVVVREWQGALSWVSVLNDRYGVYVAAGYAGDTAGIGTYLSVAVRLTLLVVTVGVAMRSAQPERGYWALLAVSLAFLALGTVSVPLGRMEAYFTLGATVLIARMVVESRHRATVLVGLAVVGSIHFFFFVTRYHGLLPYRWEGP